MSGDITEAGLWEYYPIITRPGFILIFIFKINIIGGTQDDLSIMNEHLLTKSTSI